jgi:hypothetical protein
MDYIEQIKSKYKFVIVRSAYELMDHPLGKQIFPGIIALKTKGYRQEYQKGVLPFDSSDFIATHLLLCDVSGQTMKPVLGFKSVTLENCDSHRIAFPMLGMLDRQDDIKGDKKVIEAILDEYRKTKKSSKIAYNGSFTILPELRQDKAFMKHLWDLSFSLLANYYSEFNIDHVLAVCATKFHVNKKKENFGWNYIQGPSSVLGEYPCRALFGAGLVPMELKTAHPDCQKSRNLFYEMWLNRLTLEQEIPQEHPEAA